MAKIQHDMWGTPPLLVECIIEVLGKRFFEPLIPTQEAIVIEPAAGAGAFVEGLISKGIPRKNIIAFENDLALNRQLRKFEVELHGNFYGWRTQIPEARFTTMNTVFVGIGNPPFCNDAAVGFLRELKVMCTRIAFLCPLGWMEPAQSRKWKPAPPFEDSDKGRVIYGGLSTIYPMERVHFEDFTTDKPVTGTGGRPTNLFVYDLVRPGKDGWDRRTSPRISWDLDDLWSERLRADGR